MTTAEYNARMSERGKSRFASSDRRYVRRRLKALGRLDTDGRRHARRERTRNDTKGEPE